MDPSFGVRLRSHRERHGIALETIAERTKIKLALLQALERDDVSQWPHGIFRRSHVRVYAQAIGLDPDAVVREFIEIHPDPAEEIPTILEATQQTTGESAGRAPKTRIGLLVDSALGAVRARPREGHPSGDSVPVPAQSAVPSSSPSDIERELTSLAGLCTRLGRAHDLREVVPVLEEASGLIDAVGLVLWRWDQEGGVLTPVLTLGYSNEMVARLATVPRDADNAIGAAFRSVETRVVGGTDVETGAVVVPAVTAAGCVGVLALELPAPGVRRAFVRAVASILTAQLAGLVGPFDAAQGRPGPPIEAVSSS